MIKKRTLKKGILVKSKSQEISVLASAGGVFELNQPIFFLMAHIYRGELSKLYNQRIVETIFDWVIPL